MLIKKTEPLIVSFSGAQTGMTTQQKLTFYDYMCELMQSNIDGKIIFKHGGCIGADETAHLIVCALRKSVNADVEIHVHPALVAKQKKAILDEATIDVLHEPKKPLVRNDDMAHACHKLVATPSQDHEVLRSGTWSTIRYARKYKKRIRVIHPDGGFFEP